MSSLIKYSYFYTRIVFILDVHPCKLFLYKKNFHLEVAKSLVYLECFPKIYTFYVNKQNRSEPYFENCKYLKTTILKVKGYALIFTINTDDNISILDFIKSAFCEMQRLLISLVSRIFTIITRYNR